jgi:hypothetical protein
MSTEPLDLPARSAAMGHTASIFPGPDLDAEAPSGPK